MNEFARSNYIAIYVPSLGGGGAERIMVRLANGFAALGHRVDLVLVKAEGPYLSEVGQGVRIVDLDKGRVLASLIPLIRYLRRERPVAMLSALTHANIIALLARKLAEVPLRLVVSEHSAPSGNLRCGGVVNRILRMLMYRLYPHADSIVSISRGVQDELQHFLDVAPEKFCTIYNPVDIGTIRRLSLCGPDHAWFTHHDVPVILAVGRLTAAKDFPTLLRAFALLREKRRLRLIILGKGEEEAALRKLADALGISGDVDFPGFQENPYGWMAVCDLYVMSSAWEGLGGALLEAMACGARVVSTDCRAGPGEILEGGRWGRLVPVGDTSAMADAMEAALNDPHPPDVRERANAFRADQAIEAYANVLGLQDQSREDYAR